MTRAWQLIRDGGAAISRLSHRQTVKNPERKGNLPFISDKISEIEYEVILDVANRDPDSFDWSSENVTAIMNPKKGVSLQNNLLLHVSLEMKERISEIEWNVKVTSRHRRLCVGYMFVHQKKSLDLFMGTKKESLNLGTKGKGSM